MVKARKQGSEIEAQVKRLDNLENKMKAREAELAKREKQLDKREDKVNEAMVELAKRKSTKVVVVQPRQPRSSVRIYRDRYLYTTPVITSSVYGLTSPYFYNYSTYCGNNGYNYYSHNGYNLFHVSRTRGHGTILKSCP